MGLVWEGVAAGRITRADWVRLCAEAPARTFGLWPAKGNLRVGADADVVVWDPGARPVARRRRALHMAVDHSPYHGMTVTGWPELVFARGDLVARDGRYVGEPARGRYVSRAPRPSMTPLPSSADREADRRAGARRYAIASRSNGRCSSSRRSSGSRSGR